MSNRRPGFLSLFSGAGGFDLGLEAAGWECLYASDIDPSAVATLGANAGHALGGRRRALSEAFVEVADVQALSGADMLARAGARRGDVPLLVGGPPCQSWSSAGRQQGFSDPRGRLFEDFVRVAGETDARWLLMENVRGFLTARGADGVPGSALASVRRALLRAGYQTTVALLNAADYGVPQRRVRLFMVGFRAGDPPAFPEPTHARQARLGVPGWLPLASALATVRPLSEAELLRPSGKMASDLAGLLPGNGVKSIGKTERTRPGGHWGYRQGGFVADPGVPARTVTANQQQDWVIDPEHGLRRLCPRECAAAQGFPPGWRFVGNLATQYRLIGNAVPPPVGDVIGRSLLAHRQSAATVAPLIDDVLPLSAQLAYHVRYTTREEASNGASRRAAPDRRQVRRSLAPACQ